MSKIRSFTVLPALPDRLKSLKKIARNLFWVWNSECANLFKRIDLNLWEKCNHNPVKLLASVPQKTLERLAENRGFLAELDRAEEKLDSYLESTGWFEESKTDGKGGDKSLIAYFSAEFGLHESLPFYSGGLGILAGDHLKSASDLGVPMVGVGLAYQNGYFRQYLSIDGWQQEVYAENDFYTMPLTLVTDDSDNPVKIDVAYPQTNVKAQIWKLQVGRVPLYMLDTNIDDNQPEDRMITSTLYGGDREIRIRQEIMLGIGGMKALDALGITPSVCHMNEGHAAFMALERIRLLMEKEKASFEQAREACRSGSVFTIHTPVKAGNDEFPPQMMTKYFEKYYPALGLDEKSFLALGRVDSSDEKEFFKMPVLAINTSSYRNGVSRLHGEVSRKMWSNLWKGIPVNEVPIKSVTNGVHIKSWLSEELDLLYEKYLGVEWGNQNFDDQIWNNIDQIPDEELWRAHQRCKSELVSFARKRLKEQMERRGTYHTELNWAEEILDPEALTIGFARRFATYKRGNLILKDPKRLVRLLNDTQRPVQFVFAGKAHPRDNEGKDIIRQIIHFVSHYNIRRKLVFLEDYDINVGRELIKGVDVWLNNPRPPMEASGTSGMKAAMNGALNMSTWDGWWCEGYVPDGGWVIGAGETYEDTEYQDMIESQAIYNILENEVVPLFYTRTADNLPRGWIYRMKKAIRTMTPKFNTHRMVAEYTDKFYRPSTERWRYLTSDNMKPAKEISQWKQTISSAWKKFSIEDVKVTVYNGQPEQSFESKRQRLTVGSQLNVKALVKLPEIDPENVDVQIYYGQVDTWSQIKDGEIAPMKRSGQADGDKYWFEGSVKCHNSGRQGLTVRVLPKCDKLPDQCEPGLILWENGNG